MEGWIGLAKLYLRRSGNYSDDWLLRVVDYLDLYCLGLIICDMIDFTNIESKHFLSRKLLYNGEETDLYQIYLENQLHQRCIEILQLIDSIEFGARIPHELQQILCYLRPSQIIRLENVANAVNSGDLYDVVDAVEVAEMHEQIINTGNRNVNVSQWSIFQQLQRQARRTSQTN